MSRFRAKLKKLRNHEIDAENIFNLELHLHEKVKDESTEMKFQRECNFSSLVEDERWGNERCKRLMR
jgi:hypothetical protein